MRVVNEYRDEGRSVAGEEACATRSSGTDSAGESDSTHGAELDGSRTLSAFPSQQGTDGLLELLHGCAHVNGLLVKPQPAIGFIAIPQFDWFPRAVFVDALFGGEELTVHPG